MEELPSKIRIELAIAIHNKMYSSIRFFKTRDHKFIVWIGTILRPVNIQQRDYIFKEGEEITEVYFLLQGRAVYVLPRFSNASYSTIEVGDHFGHIDLANDREFLKNRLSLRKQRKKNAVTLLRMFTV